MAGDTSAAPALGTDGFPLSGWAPPAAPPQAGPAAAPAPPPAPAPPSAPVPPPAPAPVAAAPAAPKSKARFAGGMHTRNVQLAFPIEFDGRTFDSITVKRLTARDFAAYFDTPVEERGRLPAFVDETGRPIPDEVLDALAFEDNASVMSAMDAFLPGVLKAAPAPDPSSAPQTGEASPRP